MEILIKRSAFEDWSKEVECTGKGWHQEDNIPCRSTLKINKDDLLKRKWYKYPELEGMNYGFVCPACGCFTEIPSGELDKHLQKMAKNYLDRNK